MSDVAPERHWAELFAATETDRAGEPSWLAALRKAAIARFGEVGFPTRRLEEWKYTNPAPIGKVAWAPAAPADVSRAALDALGLPLDAGPRLVFVNGRHAPKLSDVSADPNVVVTSFETLRKRDPAALEAALLPRALAEEGAFPLLARSFATDGAWIHIGARYAAARPISLLFVSAPGAAPTVSHARFVVEAAAGSSAVLHEIHLSMGPGTHLANALGELCAGENTQLRHVKLLIEGPQLTHLAHTSLRALRDANVRSTLVSLGSGVARHDLVAVLDGPGAECALDGLYVGCDGQHVDVHTTVDHRKPHGTSREHVKGILSGRSRGIFSGKVIVRPEAQKSDSQQKNDNLLLSRDAEVDSKPQLEIEADDVKCSHGSTIGQLDADAIFYLRSRGIGESEATALLTRGFAAQVLEPIDDARLREHIEALVLRRLFGAAR